MGTDAKGGPLVGQEGSGGGLCQGPVLCTSSNRSLLSSSGEGNSDYGSDEAVP